MFHLILVFMQNIIIKDCFWCGTKRTYVLKSTFLDTDGKGGQTLKKEYVCSCCRGIFITEN